MKDKKQYRLKRWYPTLPNDWKTEHDYVYYKEESLMVNKLLMTTHIINFKHLEYRDFWELIEEKKPKPLFITEDGVDIFLGHSYILIDKEFIKHKQTASNIVYTEYFKKFKHESNADDYILWNKPLLSLNDIDDTIEMYTHEFEELIKLAKERCICFKKKK